MEPVRLILDTDMDTDCDDAGALALVHHAVQHGICRLSAVVCDVPYPQAAACADLLNKYYSNEKIPVGIVKIPGHATSPVYKNYRTIRENIPENRRYNELFDLSYGIVGAGAQPSFPDSNELYRKILAESPDNSVIICAIGLLTALDRLLSSVPDQFSPLNGKDLVAAKVRLLVTMAVLSYPDESAEEFNWRMDITAAQKVIEDWPSQIVISSSGWRILTGERLIRETDSSHPLNFIYSTYLRGIGPARPSWDQIAVLYALGRTDLFSVTWGRTLRYDESDDVFRWKDDPEQKFGYTVPLLPDDQLAELIEDLMITASAAIKHQTDQ